MSAREFQEVKAALDRLMSAYAQECAYSISTALAERDKWSEEEGTWWKWNLEVLGVYNEFTETVSIIWPGNEKKVNDWVQFVDDAVEAYREEGDKENE